MTRIAVLLCGLVFPVGPTSMAATVSYQERLEAQEKIERSRREDLNGSGKVFEEALPRRILETKVTTYLKRSLAIERVWKTQITVEALRREMSRIRRQTRYPARLARLEKSLGGNELVILETFARPVLVDRLIKNLYWGDGPMHREARERAERVRNGLSRSRQGFASLADRHERLRIRPGRPADLREQPGELTVSAPRFAGLRARLSSLSGEPGGVEELRDKFVILVPITVSEAEIELEIFSIHKRPFEGWWSEWEATLGGDGTWLRLGFDSLTPIAEAYVVPDDPRDHGGGSEASGPVAESCDPDDHWDNGSLDDRLTPRARHTAVWTGSVMLIWGGVDLAGLIAGGETYDPLTDTWTPMSTMNQPSPRVNHTAVWTGQEMIVWGGLGLDTGGRYDPQTDTWSAMTTAGAAGGRSEHTAVWTGAEMIVWGGRSGSTNLNTGGAYDPALNSWRPTTLAGAPSARVEHTAVWTGQQMIVWGGWVNTGGRYDPVADSWSSVSTLNAPGARGAHAAVWTGSVMVVWGGVDAGGNELISGGRYEPLAGTWSPTSPSNAPSGRVGPAAIWTGQSVVVWGGATPVGPNGINTGGRYDPVSDQWASTSMAGAPAPRYEHSAVWTGTVMLVWGGADNLGQYVHETGARYDPVDDHWVGINPPSWRSEHGAVWTGSRMIIWGGWDYARLDSGWIYDALTDAWSEISREGAPEPRTSHTALWTGSVMIVWGGIDWDVSGTIHHFSSGGRYDPASDTWLGTSVQGAPDPRRGHSAIWTGSEMIVWGGQNETVLGDGGRYDPSADQWTMTPASGAPAPRAFHSAVWTGREMIVWGGGSTSAVLSSGAIYDPALDAWRAILAAGAPAPREAHAAVWTGSEMIVWGGWDRTDYVYSGGRYDPLADSWRSVSRADAPSNGFPVAVWSGSEMLVRGAASNAGGRYHPRVDTWFPMTTVNAPVFFGDHTVVWTGGEMIAWGNADGVRGAGGRYSPGTDVSPDSDADGVTICLGDCDDADGAVFPTAPQICDGRNNDCKSAGWPSLAGTNEADDDGDGPSECQGDCADEDAQVWTPPGEAQNLVAAASGSFSWDAPAIMGGAVVAYDALRSGDADDFQTAVVCVESDDPADRTMTDAAYPPAGGLFYYLIRPENACPSGQGPLGFSSTGALLAGRSCP